MPQHTDKSDESLTALDTIAAIATPLGRGGIGVVRVSGLAVPQIAQKLLGKMPLPRQALLSDFRAGNGELLDQGIALFFPAPHSFTGEHVLELQGHGGIVVMDQLLHATLEAGARVARPGEFSERAFLNGKLDLTQAEAIADLIDSASVQAARCALRSLQGVFSQRINELVQSLIELRTYIEAGIDFVEEEIDLLSDGMVLQKIKRLLQQIEIIFAQAQQGFLLKEGMHLVLVGAPNVGKSSLLNSLAGRETAIVTPIAGTTRDLVRDHILLDGMPLHIIDTAGLRETEDIVEKQGIERTRRVMSEADLVIVLLDDRHPEDVAETELLQQLKIKPLLVRNKIDLSGHAAGLTSDGVLYLSAKTGEGIIELKDYLRRQMGLGVQTEGQFMARRRHLTALSTAKEALNRSLNNVELRHSELLAEELRFAQLALSEITGAFTADDLLGEIFSSFCIGK
jgi:tRNA modification GTPase